MPFNDVPADDAAELTSVRGLILASPNGTKYRLWVGDGGRLEIREIVGWRDKRAELDAATG